MAATLVISAIRSPGPAVRATFLFYSCCFFKQVVTLHTRTVSVHSVREEGASESLVLCVFAWVGERRWTILFTTASSPGGLAGCWVLDSVAAL